VSLVIEEGCAAARQTQASRVCPPSQRLQTGCRCRRRMRGSRSGGAAPPDAGGAAPPHQPSVGEARRQRRRRAGSQTDARSPLCRTREMRALQGLVLAVAAWVGACVTPNIGHLEIVAPFRFQLMYSPAWFGTIVLPPGRVTADLQYAGDACETLLGSYAVRGKVALVDRGKCSFVQKVRRIPQDTTSCVAGPAAAVVGGARSQQSGL